MAPLAGASRLVPESPGDRARPAERLRQLGLHARKRLSQAFLADGRVADAIVGAAKLDPARDEVLEVGPGLGILTERLVRCVRRVVAVELDAQLAQRLRLDLPAPNLEVHEADILGFDPSTAFGGPYVVVANLPYHITSPVLRHLLEAGPPFASRLVVMVQREVAERIAARPGELSALAVAIQAQAAVHVVRQVPAGAFYPRPKVDSTVLLIQPLPAGARAIPRASFATFVAFLHAGFTQPRKTLANSLAQGLRVDRATILPGLEARGIDPRRRPGTLSVREWAALFEELTP